jgi:Tfp pilus assembly protein PilN
MDTLLKISSAFKYNKIGIVVICNKKTGYNVSFYQLIKKGNSVDICYEQNDLKSFEEINLKSINYPVILNFQGIGLVQRTIAGANMDIQQIIPNIKADEYLMELDESNPDVKLVVLCRKDLIENILENSELERLPIHSISLGLYGVSKWLNLFSEEVNQFDIEGNTLHFKNDKIIKIQKNENENDQHYSFAGKIRKPSEITAIASGLLYFTKNRWNTFQIHSIKEKIREYTASRISLFLICYLGTTIFLLLLVNFFLLESYSSKSLLLENDLHDFVMIQNEIAHLQTDINVKKQFIQQNSVSEDLAFSFYIDRLAAGMPERIYLSKLSVSPIDGKVKDGEAIKFQRKIMHLKGTATDPVIFSIFLRKINESSWIKKVQKQIYSFNNENNNGDFELEILLNDEIH